MTWGGAGGTEWGRGASPVSVLLCPAATVLLHPLVLSFPISLSQLPLPRRTQPAYLNLNLSSSSGCVRGIVFCMPRVNGTLGGNGALGGPEWGDCHLSHSRPCHVLGPQVSFGPWKQEQSWGLTVARETLGPGVASLSHRPAPALTMAVSFCPCAQPTSAPACVYRMCLCLTLRAGAPDRPQRVEEVQISLEKG